jgi:molybdopterin-containing oxidoreductase family iron-sulfur binding subunit
VYPIRTSDALWFGGDLSVSPTGRTYQLVSTQNHWTLEGRDIYRVGSLEQFREDPKSIARDVYNKKYGRDEPGYISLMPGVDYSGRNKWGMTINLNACIGCNACVVACQAENNIPIVGKDQVAVGREMHWIRIDRYFAGADLDNPATYVMPLTCMQCENAPCEVVCPVAATVHDYEGINNMVYNRCVGTKYCSNNCPYKVRRFNFLQYSDLNTISLQLARNPEVTVRNRGVMEKCTYCVQRISNARIEAKKAAVAAGQTEYTIADGTIVTACEGACPTAAIVFGDLNDPESRVAKWHKQGHNYYILGELNTKPRTTYLARVRNPNTDLELEG